MQPSAMQMMKGQGVPGGNQFQFFPIQVGGPTPYARSRKLLFIGVGIYQLVMALMALIEFQNFLSGIIMIIGCTAALMAFKEDLNITYICWWGVISLVGCIAGLVGAFIGFAVKISTIVIKFNIPLSCFFGMALAWVIYSDYETEHPECTDMVASWLRAFGLLKPKVMPATASNTLLSKSQLPMFGNADSMKGMAGMGAGGGMAGMTGMANAQYNQAAALYPGYRDQAAQQANQYGAIANDNMGMAQAKAEEGKGFASGWFGTATAAAGGAQAGAASQPAGAFQGTRDVRRDPFLTA